MYRSKAHKETHSLPSIFRCLVSFKAGGINHRFLESFMPFSHSLPSTQRMYSTYVSSRLYKGMYCCIVLTTTATMSTTRGDLLSLSHTPSGTHRATIGSRPTRKDIATTSPAGSTLSYYNSHDLLIHQNADKTMESI